MTRTKPSIQMTVPVDDLFMSAASTTGVPADWAEAELIGSTYGVDVTVDHAMRPAVSIEAAYVIRDARVAAQQELQDALVAEADMAERIDAWQRARNDYLTHNMPREGTLRPNGNEGWSRINRVRVDTANACMAAEVAAGIPEAVQACLTWPAHGDPLPYDDTPTTYQPPTS